MRVLGIETSCDETGVAIYDEQHGILTERLYSQVGLHKEFGGVVPELASRDHVLRLLPLIDEVLAEANCSKDDIDGIAYTEGPGLVGALMVGAATAKSLGFVWQKPVVGVHHMEGHLLAPLLEQEQPSFPLVALLVSGGHTQLVLVNAIGDYQLLGESLDDAAGEAFDKAAKMLGLSYPGGPAIAKAAEKGDATRFDFPRPMVGKPGLDFSFSGIKTFTLTLVESLGELTEQDIADVAASFQAAMVDTLTIKCKRALKQTGVKQLIIAGGVSANQELRKSLDAMAHKQKAKLFYARPALCTDNGAMIAFAGCKRLAAGQSANEGIAVRPRWPLSELEAI